MSNLVETVLENADEAGVPLITVVGGAIAAVGAMSLIGYGVYRVGKAVAGLLRKPKAEEPEVATEASAAPLEQAA